MSTGCIRGVFRVGRSPEVWEIHRLVMPGVGGSSPLIRPIFAINATFMQLGYFPSHSISFGNFLIKALFEASLLAVT